MKTPLRFLAPLLAAALALAPAAANAATIVIVNNDGLNEGFNDPSPRAAVGGNNGLTLGQQRLNVFQHAADIWGALLPSAVTIQVRAQFNPQTCDVNGAVLGSAGAVTIHRNFTGAEFTDTWYPQSLANRLRGLDLDAGNPDINATFNVSIDSGCFPAGGVWYYGFDGNEGANLELLPVVLHEIGHGLGFQTFVALASGALNGGFPDIFSRFIFDNTTGLFWNQMTNGQRQASAVNTGNVVWNGPATNLKAPQLLDKRAQLTVTSPPLGAFAAGRASFGAALTAAGVSGQLILGQDAVAPVNDGCTSDTTAALLGGVAGRVVLLDRGLCAFTLKAQAAQNAGAIALIIANNAVGPAPELGGSEPLVTIPVISVSQADGVTLKNQLLGGPVNVTVTTHPTLLAGADNAGRVRLYAPNPLMSGSSISHFDVPLSPDALMEPFVNDGLSDEVDLTLYLFDDIGWLDAITGVPPGTAPALQLRAAAPNPFSTRTTLRYDLPTAGMTELGIYDLRGSLVKRIHGGYRTAGPYTETWDGTDSQGHRMPAGVYLYRLKTAQGTAAKRMVLLP